MTIQKNHMIPSQHSPFSTTIYFSAPNVVQVDDLNAPQDYSATYFSAPNVLHDDDPDAPQDYAKCIVDWARVGLIIGQDRTSAAEKIIGAMNTGYLNLSGESALTSLPVLLPAGVYALDLSGCSALTSLPENMAASWVNLTGCSATLPQHMMTSKHVTVVRD